MMNPRNLFIDIESLVGASVRDLAVLPKRYERPEDPSRDVFGPNRFVHFETGPSPGWSNYRSVHAHAFELAGDLPSAMKRRDNSAIFTFPDLPLLDEVPASHGPRRNLVVDVEAIASGARLIEAVLVPKRDRVGSFVHCLFEDAEGLPEDLDDFGARARESMQGMPAWMRRQDGGPLHVFWGVPVRES